MTRTKSTFLGLLAVLLSPMAANADLIIGAVDVTATNSIAGSLGDPNVLINQGGLITGYTSGVTDFDAYVAGDPQHSYLALGNEWFTGFGFSSATLTFDLGAAIETSGLAAWVDEFWGAGTISVSASLDGIGYTGLGSFDPTDWATSVTSYGADIFSFGATTARYIRLDLSDCPQPDSVTGGGCGMGEVAFRQSVSVPEPGTLALLGIGLAGLGLTRRRRKV